MQIRWLFTNFLFRCILLFVSTWILFSCDELNSKQNELKDLIDIRKVVKSVKTINRGKDYTVKFQLLSDSIAQNSQLRSREFNKAMEIIFIGYNKNLGYDTRLNALNLILLDKNSGELSVYNKHLIHSSLAVVNIRQADYFLSLDNFFASINLLEPNEKLYFPEIGETYMLIAHISSHYLKVKLKTKDMFLTSARFNERYNNFDLSYKSYYNLATFYHEELKEYDSSKIFLKRSLENLSLVAGKTRTIWEAILASQAENHIRLKEYDSAVLMGDLVKDAYLKEEISQKRYIEFQVHYLLILLKLNRENEALEIVKKFKKEYTNNCINRYLYSLVFSFELEYFKKRNNDKKQKEILEKLFNICSKCGNLNSYFENKIHEALDALILLDKKSGNQRDLSIWLENKLLYKKDVGQSIKVLDKQLQYFNDKDILNSEKEINVQNEKLFKGKLVIAVVSVLILLLFFLLWTISDLMNKVKLKEKSLIGQEKTLRKNNKLISNQNAKMQSLVNELEGSNDHLSNFAYLAAHDLKSPLIRINQVSENIYTSEKQGFWNEEQNELFEFLFKSSRNLKALIEGLLSFSAINSNNVLGSRVNLYSILLDIKEILKFDLKKKEATLDIFNNSSVIVYAEDSLMEQLFLNLISNSIKFSREDVPSVISVSLESENEEFITICVADNGLGISEENQKEIFKAFKKFHSSSTVKGYGIGLATCKKIVESFEGEISVSSKVGVGTKFYIQLKKFDSELRH